MSSLFDKEKAQTLVDRVLPRLRGESSRVLMELAHFPGSDTALSQAYVLGVSNSRVLNWRLKLAITNNYVSAGEVEALPIPRCTAAMDESLDEREIAATLHGLIAGTSPGSLKASVLTLESVQSHWGAAVSGGRVGAMD